MVIRKQAIVIYYNAKVLIRFQANVGGGLIKNVKS